MADDAVTVWVRNAVARIEAEDRPFESAHLDQISEDEVPTTLTDLAAILREGSLGRPAGWKGLLLLAIPHEATLDQITDPASLAELRRDEFEPPSMYVVRSEADLEEEPSTEICRLQVSSPDGLDDIALELASRRDVDARRFGWEFTNTIWMQLR